MEQLLQSNPCIVVESIPTFEQDGTPIGTTHRISIYDLANHCYLGYAIGYHEPEATARACAERWANFYNLPIGYKVVQKVQVNGQSNGG